MTQDFDSLYEHVTSALKTKGLPAAVRVITRIYEESDSANPWSSFNMSSGHGSGAHRSMDVRARQDGQEDL